MVEGLWTRLTSPIIGLIEGTWEEMKSRPSLNPFSEGFNTLSRLKWGIGAIIVIFIFVAGIYALTQVMAIATTGKQLIK